MLESTSHVCHGMGGGVAAYIPGAPRPEVNIITQGLTRWNLTQGGLFSKALPLATVFTFSLPQLQFPGCIRFLGMLKHIATNWVA